MRSMHLQLHISYLKYVENVSRIFLLIQTITAIYKHVYIVHFAGIYNIHTYIIYFHHMTQHILLHLHIYIQNIHTSYCWNFNFLDDCSFFSAQLTEKFIIYCRVFIKYIFLQFITRYKIYCKLTKNFINNILSRVSLFFFCSLKMYVFFHRILGRSFCLPIPKQFSHTIQRKIQTDMYNQGKIGKKYDRI